MDRSCVLLTIVRKSCTPNAAEVLDTDTEPRSSNCVAKEELFLYEWVRWENHFRRYYYNGRTVVIFTYYKRWIELDTLKLVQLRWQQAVFTFYAPWNPETIKNCSQRQLNARQLTTPFLFSFGMKCYLNILFLRFSGYFWVFMATYIFPFLKHFLSVRSLAKNDVKPYRRTNRR